MPEGLNFNEKGEGKENLELLPYFPTDLERAKEGLGKFNEVFERSEVLRKISFKDQYFKTKLKYSVMGFMPEMGCYGGGGFQELDTAAERAELKRIYEDELGLKTFHWQRSDENEKWDSSVLNPASVERVIKNCPIPNLFPEEARKNPMEWVLQNPEEWENRKDPIRTARFGILSGYPPHASSVFEQYSKAQKILNKNFSKRELAPYYKYANSPRENRTLPKSFEKKLNSLVSSKKIKNSQSELLKNWFSNHANELEYFGDGFSDEDAAYFENIKTLLTELGIDYTKNIYEK